jgi:phosphoribosylformylglycinamidine synthase
MTVPKALVLTGFGLNCDYETNYALGLAGAESHREHINEVIAGSISDSVLDRYQILVFGGGFSWADDHGAGVLLALKIKNNMGEQLQRFIRKGTSLWASATGSRAWSIQACFPALGGSTMIAGLH